MSKQRAVEILRIDPRTSAIAAMIHELDRYMGELYPAESNHLVDLNTLAQPHVHFFGVLVDGEYRGCGAIMLVGREYAEVKRVFVSPEARGLRLGHQIIETLEEAARSEGISLLRLETGNAQKEALGLFEANGFRRCGAFGDYPKDDPYSVFMEKTV
jgi:putative acetyltransferase